MALINFQEYVKFLPVIERVPESNLWMWYDKEADVLYVNFKHPNDSTDSEPTDEGVIVHYEGDNVVGLTILHASKRNSE